MAVAAIIAVLAIPSYVRNITTGRRSAAEACTMQYVAYMERYKADNRSYMTNRSGTANTLPTLTCAGSDQTGTWYTYNLKVVSDATYTLEADPQGVQATRDAACGNLSIDETGKTSHSGTAAAGTCWRQ